MTRTLFAEAAAALCGAGLLCLHGCREPPGACVHYTQGTETLSLKKSNDSLTLFIFVCRRRRRQLELWSLLPPASLLLLLLLASILSFILSRILPGHHD